MPQGIKIIGKCAFQGSTFSEILLPDGLEEIGDSAFEDCWYLDSITIPKSVKSIKA